MRVLVCIGLLVAALVAVEGAAAQAEPATADVEVTVWRRVSNPSLLYLSTRPEGGRWHTENTALDMSALSSTGRFHQSNAVTVAVPLPGGTTANVEVTVWRRVSNPSLLYLSTRPEGGRWHTENTALDMSALSSTGRFHQSNAVLVTVPLPDTSQPEAPPAAACAFSEHVDRVAAATFQVRTSESIGTAFYIGNGEWVTNHHVVGDNSVVLLRHGEDQMWANVVGTLASYDLALLKAQPGEAISSLEFAPTRPSLASAVTVVGFPAYVQDTPSVVRGIVSKHVPLSQFEGMASDGMALQTDAPANPGNSGGPIVDDCGAVVAVTFSRYEYTAGGRPIQGIGFGIAAETVVAQIPSLRAGRSDADPAPDQINNLTISAFCSRTLDELPALEECEERSRAFDTSWGSWALYATDVVEFDDVVYRFDGEGYLVQEEVMPALLALDVGCHELEIAEEGISTHWSLPYEFCFVDSTPPADSTIPATPTGLWVAKIDLAFAPDDIRVSWNAVPGATWYELYHAAGDGEWVFKATVTNTTYVDTFPSLLFADHYTVNACNAAGCSEFSTVATQY